MDFKPFSLHFLSFLCVCGCVRVFVRVFDDTLGHKCGVCVRVRVCVRAVQYV